MRRALINCSAQKYFRELNVISMPKIYNEKNQTADKMLTMWESIESRGSKRELAKDEIHCCGFSFEIAANGIERKRMRE